MKNPVINAFISENLLSRKNKIKYLELWGGLGTIILYECTE